MSNKGKAKWNILRYKAFHSSRSVEKCYKGGSLSPIDGATESLSSPSAICRRFPEAVNGIGGAAGQLAIVGIIQNLLLSHYSNSHPQALSSHIIQNLLPSHYSKAPLHALSSPIIQNLPPHIIQNLPLSHYSKSPLRALLWFLRLTIAWPNIFHFTSIQAFPSHYQIPVGIPKCPFANWKLDPPISQTSQSTPDLFSSDDASLLRPCLAILFHQLTFWYIRK